MIWAWGALMHGGSIVAAVVVMVLTLLLPQHLTAVSGVGVWTTIETAKCCWRAFGFAVLLERVAVAKPTCGAIARQWLHFSSSLVLQHGLLSHTLRLVHNILTYDFIGSSTDESSDDLCTVQIPTTWRSGEKGICCRHWWPCTVSHCNQPNSQMGGTEVLNAAGSWQRFRLISHSFNQECWGGEGTTDLG